MDKKEMRLLPKVTIQHVAYGIANPDAPEIVEQLGKEFIAFGYTMNIAPRFAFDPHHTRASLTSEDFGLIPMGFDRKPLLCRHFLEWLEQ